MHLELDYERWKNDNIDTLVELNTKNVVLSFSGGRDCSLILEFMTQAQQEFDFSFRVVTGKYPNHCFPEEHTKEIDEYWRNRGIEIEFHKIEKDDNQCEQALRSNSNPCDVCHTKRLAYLAKFVQEYAPESLVVIIGYTLWDLVSYSLEYLLGAPYASCSSTSPFQGDYAKARFQKRTSKRFHAFYQTNAGYSVFSPLVFYNDPEVFDALEKYKTKILEAPCRYSSFRPKRILSEVYKRMGLVFDYDKVMDFAREALSLDAGESVDWTEESFS
jgi:tRNA(Ile)-lysidine synthase TilS/MesJ